MNDLLTHKRIADFETLLAAYSNVSGGNHFDAIDGGAGFGSTATKIMRHLGPRQQVHAFEPFPGNHRFLAQVDPRIRLIPMAMAEKNGSMTFRVPSVVSEDSEWGQRGMAGYSSVGFLVSGNPTSQSDITVSCARTDDVIPADRNIGFVKLDLQGGELAALLGMPRIVASAHLMWVEFTGQEGLLDFLFENDFVVFDTEYFLMGQPTQEALVHFEQSRADVTLSTGQKAWFGFRKTGWKNYLSEFDAARQQFKLVQTDLVCVKRAHLQAVTTALLEAK